MTVKDGKEGFMSKYFLMAAVVFIFAGCGTSYSSKYLEYMVEKSNSSQKVPVNLEQEINRLQQEITRLQTLREQSALVNYLQKEVQLYDHMTFVVYQNQTVCLFLNRKLEQNESDCVSSLGPAWSKIPLEYPRPYECPKSYIQKEGQMVFCSFQAGCFPFDFGVTVFKNCIEGVHKYSEQIIC